MYPETLIIGLAWIPLNDKLSQAAVDCKSYFSLVKYKMVIIPFIVLFFVTVLYISSMFGRTIDGILLAMSSLSLS